MSSTGIEPPAAGQSHTSRRASFMHRLRNSFLTGLVVGAPLFLTVYITWSFVQWIDGLVEPFIPFPYRLDRYLPFEVPGFGLVVALIFIALLGFLTANLVGRRLVAVGEGLLDRMPLIRNLYRGLKQIVETVISKKARTFEAVGLIEFPRLGMWSLVFVVSATKGEVREKIKDQEDDMVSVFVPTTPTPLSGYLVFMKRRDVIMLDMSIEAGAKMIISAGLVTPEYGAIAADLVAADRRRRKIASVNPPSAA
ncbi:MAG: DUF502 domain-containing protein [Bauldia sp.]